MNRNAAIIMLILAIALGIGTYLIIKMVPTQEEQKQKELEVFDFQVQRVIRFAAKRGADLVYDIALEKNEWVYKYPPLGKADPAKVLRALSDLRFEAKIIQDLTEGGNRTQLNRYGFDKARYEVDVYTHGRNYIFQIGDENATKDGLYIRVLPGDRIIVTLPIVRTLFEVLPDSFLLTDPTMTDPGPQNK